MGALERHRLMCGRCRLLLNVFTHPDGFKEYQHTRIWEEHDHDPVPVPAVGGTELLTCDFCGGHGPKYLYEGDTDLELRLGNRVYDYGRIWAACVACDRFLRRSDLVGLSRHCNKGGRIDTIVKEKLERDRGRELTETELNRLAAERDEFHRVFLSTAPRRRLIPPPPPPPVPLTPARMPRVRDRLVEYWRSDLIRDVLSTPTLPQPVALPGEDMGSPNFSVITLQVPSTAVEAFCARQATAVEQAQLYWVSTEFSTLAVGAGAKLPDLSVTAEDLPAPSGLIVYAEPVLSTSVGLLVSAIGWTVVSGGVWSTLYVQPENAFTGVDRDELRRRFGFLSALSPGGGIPFGLHERPDNTAAARGAATAWATLLSTWFLMKQPGVATVTEHAMDKKETARFRRAGRRPPVVRLVDLRRQATKNAAAADGTGRTFHYSVRFVVGGKTGGFWRDQAYGPGRSQRRRQWIAPFLKGPQDAPLQPAPPVVNVLR